jgi:hypothetical protein
MELGEAQRLISSDWYAAWVGVVLSRFWLLHIVAR